jgi:hypothetical protein
VSNRAKSAATVPKATPGWPLDDATHELGHSYPIWLGSRAVRRHAIFNRSQLGSGLMRPASEDKIGRCIVPLVQLVLVLIVVGVLLWLVNNYIPMQSSIKSILNAVVVIAVVLWLLNVFGLFTSLSRLHVGR